ncbi:hypothetical protein IFM89_031716 [Coptis chinensis]|uniref:Cytochrome P450 n=1 Tax=Coptis chinensis TaxID=261450 RepID=A0A835IGQ8_9MAGN|nr:hypothetical protein IFM89_031716 [Coptis chinensis]
MMSKAFSWCLEQSKDEYSKAGLILSVVLVAIAWWNWLAMRSGKEKALLPPGPRGLPILGNLPFLDPDLHRGFAKLSMKYGPVMKVAHKMVGLIGEPNVSDLFPVLAKFDIQGKERRMREILKWFDQIFEFVINERRKMEVQQEEVENRDKENKDFLQVLLQLIDQGNQKTQLTVIHLKALLMVFSQSLLHMHCDITNQLVLDHRKR